MTARARRLLKTGGFIALLAAVMTAFVLLSQRPVNHPPIPQDAAHQGLKEWQGCLTCHGPGKPQALPSHHPLSNEKCFRCHTFPTKP